MDEDHFYTNKKKYILLLDNNKNNQENSRSSISYIDNITDYNNTLKNRKQKHKINKKFKMLRNFSSKFEKGLLCLENPHKSIFAKRIMSEIIPHNLSKKLYLKKRKKLYDNDYNLLILNTPKANFSHNFLLKETKINKKNYFSQKRKSQIIQTDFIKFFADKKENNSQINFSNFFLHRTKSINDFCNNDKCEEPIIEDIIEENNNNNINNDEDNDFVLKNKKNNDCTKETIKLNLKKIPFTKPKKLVFKKIVNNSFDYNNKKKKIPKSFSKVKLYSKKCDLKKHFIHQKFISNFLTPINQFIKNEFSITDKEYENINKKICDYNYLINNNEYSLYLNKRKKEKYKKFSPPKIENSKLKKFFSNRFREINQLKNYKFNI